MSEIVVLGSLNMDLVVRVGRIPYHGETMFGESFATFPGGKGANQAVAAARLGARVAMIGAVGTDAFGPELLEIMRCEGIESSHIEQNPHAPTGIALIMLDQAGQNTMVVVSGANTQLKTDAVLQSLEMMSDIRLLITQFEVSMDTTWAAIAWAQSRHIPVLLNAAPARQTPPARFKGIDYLVVNEQETECLTGAPVHDPSSAALAAQQMSAWGVPVVIVTLGAQGSVVWEQGQTTYLSARNVKVIDSTAAGDAFIGGLANALLNKMPITEAVRYANFAGALATTTLGAQPSLPTAEAVQRLYWDGSV
ncbi:MAG: ribokinase [Anaerolineae bacterium]